VKVGVGLLFLFFELVSSIVAIASLSALLFKLLIWEDVDGGGGGGDAETLK